ncbi:MAG: hypothetical protein FOGNACKC_00726 [Anaerolineae bacterium]|nr:hypothetical protein [Anaerolineae bacterium]
MTRFFHFTTKANLLRILSGGLRPGSETGNGEELPFVMASRTCPQVTSGGQAFLEIELDENDPRLTSVNADWIEFRGTVSPDAIVAVANPPASNDEVIGLFKKGGVDAVNQAFQFKDRS